MTEVQAYSTLKPGYLYFVVILDAPHVEIGLGKNISPNTVYEGGDVYFDCRVKAKPRYNRITWMHNVSNLLLTLKVQALSGFPFIRI